MKILNRKGITAPIWAQSIYIYYTSDLQTMCYDITLNKNCFEAYLIQLHKTLCHKDYPKKSNTSLFMLIIQENLFIINHIK